MRLFFKHDEKGFTTVGAAVALLLALALAFGGVQAYWSSTRSGQVQYVADSAALAADGAIAEFVTYGQAVDAALLSFSLVAVIVYAVSAVAAFIPGAEGVAAQFVELGGRVVNARNEFAKAADKGLAAAQAALPAVAAVRAGQAVQANADASGVGYVGAAIPLPLEGVAPNLAADDGLADALSDIAAEEAEIERNASQQQQAQQRADEARRRAWEADCGGSGMTARERAEHLVGLSGSSNPNYASPETWSWQAALDRARSYYAARYAAEPGSGYAGRPDEVAESIARKRFYAYAHEQLQGCSVAATASGLERPAFHELARNVAQIKQTSLYTESIYPVSANGSTSTIHSHAGCPGYLAGSPAGSGSVSMVDNGQLAICDKCRFSATTLGRVPSASTSINNGFEYYWRAIVLAAQDCASAVDEMDKAAEAMQGSAHVIKDLLEEAMSCAAGKRYSPQPPGRYGCIAVVYAPPAAIPVSTNFFSAQGGVAARMAISGATLAPDPATDQANVVSSIGRGLVPSSMLGAGVLKTVFSAWGSLLYAYSGGIDGIEGAFKTVLGAIPVVGTSLSSWAADEFMDALEGAGLQPSDLDAYKPVLVNTSHILAADDGAAASAIRSVKESAGALASSPGQTLSNVFSLMGMPELGSDVLGDSGLVIAGIDLGRLGLGTGSSPIAMDVPSDLLSRYSSLLAQVSAAGASGA